MAGITVTDAGVRPAARRLRRALWALIRHVDRRRPALAARWEGLPGHARMDVEMLVRVDMVELQAGPAKGGELGCDLVRAMPARSRAERVSKRRPDDRMEPAVGSDETTDGITRKNWPTVDEHEMQADPQRRHALDKPDACGGRAATIRLAAPRCPCGARVHPPR